MDKFMGSTQWLEERRKGIGSSDCAAVLGLSPWKSPYQLYTEKRGEVREWAGNSQTNWGLLMEPALRQFYSDFTGRPVRLPEKIMYHSRFPFMLASLDGFTDDARVVELKTARSGNKWGEPGTSEIPEYYLLQVQHQMIVSGFEVADVVVSIAGGSPQLYEVPADKELAEMIIEACAAFWKRVVDGNPPDAVSFADAIARFGKSTSQGAVLASQDDLSFVKDLRAVRTEKTSLEAKEEEIKGNLIISLGDRGDTLVDVNGSPLLTYKLGKGRTALDAKALERDDPETYKKYLRTGEATRRFLLKGE